MVIFNALQTSLSVGIGRYSYELAKEIYKLQKIQYKIVIREEDLDNFKFASKNDLIIVKGIKNSKERNYYEQFILPKKIYNEYPEAVIHYPDSMAPLTAKNKIIITVHDLAFKSIKGAFKRGTIIWKNVMTDLSIRKANKIIAITNFSKNEIYKYYPNVDKEKVSVVYNGFNNFSRENIEYDNISENIKQLVGEDYILTVSTISPRKNIDGLIKAFNLIKDEIKLYLVIAGIDGWMYEEVHKVASKLNLENRVIFTGGVNDEELKLLYKNTKLFVYPSFYEGFGLPPLEAMSFGIACIVSNITSIPEVVGDAAVLVNPYDITEVAGAIKKVIVDKDANNSLSGKGLNRVKKFSWEECAKNTVEIYNEYCKP